MPAPTTSVPQPVPAKSAAKTTVDTKSLNLEAISLEQALLDVEIANARVMELTRRLTTASKEIAELRGQLAGSRIPALEAEIQAAKSEVAAMRLNHAKDAALAHRPG